LPVSTPGSYVEKTL
jgi:hypothetical protein